MRPRIRQFEDRDLKAVIELSLRAWEPVFESLERELGADIFEILHPDWREDQRRVVQAALSDEETRVWVAELDESVSGFVATVLHPEGRYGEIHMLAVDPDRRNEGLGTSLTEFALDRIKEAGMPVAMVETGGDPGHAAARKTYEKAGHVLLPIARYFKKL